MCAEKPNHASPVSSEAINCYPSSRRKRGGRARQLHMHYPRLGSLGEDAFASQAGRGKIASQRCGKGCGQGRAKFLKEFRVGERGLAVQELPTNSTSSATLAIPEVETAKA